MTRRFTPSLRFLLPLSIVVGTTLASAQPSNAPDRQLASKQLNDRVDALLKTMTLDEKIGQLTQYSAGDPSNPTGPAGSTLQWDQMIERGEVGALLNVVGADASTPTVTTGSRPASGNMSNFRSASMNSTTTTSPSSDIVEPTTYNIWVGGSPLAAAETSLKIVE